jgi:hypothetical protein
MDHALWCTPQAASGPSQRQTCRFVLKLYKVVQQDHGLIDMGDGTEEMQIDPARARALVSHFSSVAERIAAAGAGRSVS